MECRKALAIALHGLKNRNEALERDSEWHMTTCSHCHKRQQQMLQSLENRRRRLVRKAHQAENSY
jgi:hypothetical protein